MFQPTTQEIQMVNVQCNLVPHQGELIRTLCLYPECQENSALCSKCLIKGHLQCRNEVFELEVIPKQLMELQQLQQAIGHLQNAINKQFKELLSTIEQLLMPISKYQDSPNLKNLNEVGSLLKKLPKQCILKSLSDMKYQIKHILENHDYQVEKDKEEVILLKVDELYQQGVTLYNQDKYDEAIKFFDKAIAINPNYQPATYLLKLAKSKGI